MRSKSGCSSSALKSQVAVVTSVFDEHLDCLGPDRRSLLIEKLGECLGNFFELIPVLCEQVLGAIVLPVNQEADLLVKHRLEQDQQVFERLLASDEFFVHHNGSNSARAAQVAKLKRQYEDTLAKVEGRDWRDDPLKVFLEVGLLKGKYVAKGSASGGKKGGKGGHDYKKKLRIQEGKIKQIVKTLERAQHVRDRGITPAPKEKRDHALAAWNVDMENWDYQPVQPMAMPNRKGMLSHPAWLIAHSQNAATDPVKRGHWILERLLAGRVPDIPIGVDARIPDDPHATLRMRLDKATNKEACWRCHEHMNPLGLAFEAFDDFGRFRLQESLEHPDNVITERTTKPNSPATYKTLPVDASGHLVGTGDQNLDGPVSGPLDMAERLAKSQRVRQSIIRHAFRYFMGRNEMLIDSQTLIDAEKAYQDNNGSFKAVVVSLLSSDSFRYRK